MFTGDKVAGTPDSIAKVFPEAAYQRCTVHFYRNVLAKAPKSKRARITPDPCAHALPKHPLEEDPHQQRHR